MTEEAACVVVHRKRTILPCTVFFVGWTVVAAYFLKWKLDNDWWEFWLSRNASMPLRKKWVRNTVFLLTFSILRRSNISFLLFRRASKISRWDFGKFFVNTVGDFRSNRRVYAIQIRLRSTSSGSSLTSSFQILSRISCCRDNEDNKSEYSWANIYYKNHTIQNERCNSFSWKIRWLLVNESHYFFLSMRKYITGDRNYTFKVTNE